MCGIIGYTGSEKAKDLLLSGLQTLEYRGYDSAGIAVADPDTNEPKIYKCAGKVAELVELCKDKTIDGFVGMGHTRWATHGGVTDANAHPHSFGRITLIHNGIIENFQELIKQYELGDKLVSETDSEVVAAVMDHFYEGDPYAAIRNTVKELKGTFALVIMFNGVPGKLFAVRNVSPIVAAHCDNGSFLASDPTALYTYSCRYFVIPEYHILELDSEEAKLYKLSGEEVMPQYLEVNWEVMKIDKKGYPFYMEKEIIEQPRAISNTIMPRIKDGLPDFTADNIPDELLTSCSKVCIIACGTAMHAGLVGKSLIQSLLGLIVNVELASEFTYTSPVVDKDTLVIAISQSGETIDTLEALKYAKKLGARNLSILNVQGSTIARESEHVLFTYAGPEIAVASTKAYTTQISALYLVACRMALLRGVFNETSARNFIKELIDVTSVVDSVIKDRNNIHMIAKSIVYSKDVFMIGRSLDYATILEGSLKLKEITYIHSEAYSSGELKHGTIALITKDTPVVAVITQSKVISKEISNVMEVSSRGAYVIMLIRDDVHLENEKKWNVVYKIPHLSDEFMVFPATVFLQLLAYYVSLDKGLDVDKPRNLAKVVTVE